MLNFALLLLGSVALPAHALTKIDLYHSEINIYPEQENADLKARISGMKEVIIRSSGDKKAIYNDVIKKALDQSSQYLTQISYSQTNGNKTIKMDFSPPNIRSILSEAELPFWKENRTNLLIWLIEKSKHNHAISWDHSDTVILNTIKYNAKKRGLPITFPIGDFEDVNNITVADLWSGSTKLLNKASKRYLTDAVLVIYAQNDNFRWILYDQKPPFISKYKVPISGNSSGNKGPEEIIDQLSNYYAKKNSVIAKVKSSKTLKAQFTMVDNMSTFFQLENRLKNLISVESVDILKIHGSSVIFNIHLLATKKNFEEEVLRMESIKGKKTKQKTSTNSSVKTDEEIDFYFTISH
ncbi:hypothetical protein CF67_03001 [Candidatus Photodesmus blepharus]|uniref:DUF2066 domain-containing protein n=1 Tax=Candidatus Photodesmus blepharonis TaxID=1179155 RepID=A0A084CN90_9GAMM|nr:DUF2066 domain-containing protein [Candidatus Photodesmus blepharus]KEY91269.1 hypothetical protein CF67_03001 [Candidatus Photodesmus blepharus]